PRARAGRRDQKVSSRCQRRDGTVSKNPAQKGGAFFCASIGLAWLLPRAVLPQAAGCLSITDAYHVPHVFIQGRTTNDTSDACCFVNRVFDRIRGGANAGNVRQQGSRKRRQGASRRGENELPREMQARRGRAQGDRLGRQAAQGRGEKKLHGQMCKGASLTRPGLKRLTGTHGPIG